MRNYVQPGDTLTFIAPRAMAGGSMFVVGSLVAVASSDAANGAPVEGVRRGVFDIPKAAGAVTQGQKLYWDNTALNLTTTASGNTLVGAAAQMAASGDPTVRVVLSEGMS